MKAFLKEALSSDSGVSSRRVCGFISVLCAFAIIPLNLIFHTYQNVDWLHYFDALLAFAAVCFGLTTFGNRFTSPNPPQT